jgi:putative two-component system response regulator
MFAELQEMQIVVIDDNRANLDLLEQILSNAGYVNVLSIADATEVRRELYDSPPDLLLLDLHMPNVDGFEILRSLRSAMGPPDYLPVCVVTADTSVDVRRQALQLGARDFLLKPVDPIEVLLRTRNLLESRYLSRTYPRALELSRMQSLERLARIAELRSAPDFDHPLRVAELAGQLAGVLGLAEEAVEEITRAAVFHDIGKIAVPEELLRTGVPLAEDELEAIRQHTVLGADMLAGAPSATIQAAATIARSHHERWNGGGYPDAFVGEAIPNEARIVAVADAYDRLTSGDAPLDVQLALATIRAEAAASFDPSVVRALATLVADAQRVPAVAAASHAGL